MNLRRFAAIFAVVGLVGCETPTIPRYSTSVDNVLAIRTLGTKAVAVGDFTMPAQFSATCRALGPIAVPDGQSHAQYIRRALMTELVVAGAHTEANPHVVLTGSVTRIEFSSMRALTGGSWDLSLTLRSSNGGTMSVDEHYEFDSGFAANDACRQTATAYTWAVQDLIRKVVTSQKFAELVY